MPFASGGNLLTDKREVATSESWDTQTEWEAYQEKNSIEIDTGTLKLIESTVPSSVIHHYPLSEGSGTSTADEVGTSDMSLNGVSWSSGTYIDGFAGSGDGTDDYGNAPLESFGSVLDGPAAVAFVFNSTADDVNLMGSLESDNNMSFGIRMGSLTGVSGAIETRIRDDAGNTQIVGTDSGYNDGNDHTVVLNKTGNAASDISFWVDGTQVASTVDTNTGDLSTVADLRYPIYFWALNLNGSSSKHANAILDDIMFANDSWSSSEVSTYHNRQPWT